MHRRFIYILKTAEDMKLYYFGSETVDIYKWVLSDDEFNSLWECGVFSYLNEKFDIMIDAFEDEYILYQYLYFYYENLVEELNKFKCRNEIRILIYMIDKAIESKTLLVFCL